MIGCCRAVNLSVLNRLRPYPAPSLSRWSPTQRSFLRFCSTSSISSLQEQREQRRRLPECQLREGLGKLAKKGGGILTVTTAAAAVDGGESGRMVSYVSATLYVVGGIVVAGMALLVAFQERLVYVPVLPGLSKSYAITPSRLRLLYEDVWLRSSDGISLHAWFIKLYPDCRGPTILFFQENAGNIAHRLEMVRIMLQKLQCNVFMLSYRGYGASDGSPSQHGIIKDAQAALDHLMQRTDIDTSQIVVFGRSLGGAVGAVLSNNNPDKVSALILENTFTSILDMAGVLLPFLKWFIGGTGSKSLKILNGVVRSPWSTIDIVGQVRQPILFLSGLQDEMVPPMHMKLLYAKVAARNKHCLFAEFPSGMHMDTWYTGGDQYWKTVQKFIKDFAVDRKQKDSSLTNSGSSSFTDSGTSSFTNSDADPW